MGGGTTSVAVFFDSELVHTDIIPVGGIHVTRDIARGLSTPMAHAERIKTLFGSCLPSPSDDRQVIEIPPMAEDGTADPTHVPRSLLVNIVRSRVEEVFEMVRANLQDAGFDKVAGRRLVLTGGASQLSGVPELAGMILNKQVRIGRPHGIDGLPDGAIAPAFATCAGLLQYAVTNGEETLTANYRPKDEPVGRLGRIGQWLRENF
jgi:cell division protein FtsA